MRRRLWEQGTSFYRWEMEARERKRRKGVLPLLSAYQALRTGHVSLDLTTSLWRSVSLAPFHR